MASPIIRRPTGGASPSPTLQLHDQLLINVKDLKARRLGKLEMDVCLTFPGEAPSHFSKTNVCQLLDTHKANNAYIYLHPKYSTPPVNSTSEVNESVTTSKDPVKVLRDNIERAAFHGHDLIVSGGRSKRQRMGSSKTDPNPLYFRCQCAKVYTGDKVDAVSGFVVDRDDYRTSTITNDAKNNRAGTKGKHGSRRTDYVRCFSKLEDKCSFQLSIFHNSFGYYIKSKIGDPYHEFHESRPYLRMPSRLEKQRKPLSSRIFTVVKRCRQ